MAVSEKENVFDGVNPLKINQLKLIHWKDLLLYNSDEINFLKLLLKADIYKPGVPNIFEKLKAYMESVEDIKSQNSRFYNVVEKKINHLRNALEKDTYPEQDFISVMENLENEIEKYFEKFNDLKLEVFHYTSKLFEKYHSPFLRHGPKEI